LKEVTVEKKKVLGRGLSALIPAVKKEGFLTISIDQIVPNPFQPRKHFSGDDIEELARSIRMNGIIEPLIVRRREGVFQLISGERRWRAAQKAGLRDVPVVVREATDRECLELALIENLQRKDLNPLDEAEGYQSLMEKFDLTQEQIAEKVGKDRATIANKLRLLKLPDRVKEALKSGAITEGHARALLSIDGSARILNALEQIIKKNLSVREAEVIARGMKSGRDGSQGRKENIHIKNFVEELQRSIHRKVSIHVQKKGSGWLRIFFSSLEDLEDIAERLKR
jgi:ParB family chromosome partitioning protein